MFGLSTMYREDSGAETADAQAVYYVQGREWCKEDSDARTADACALYYAIENASFFYVRQVRRQTSAMHPAK